MVRVLQFSAVHDPTVAIGPPGGTARAALFGPDKGPEELPTPGSTINDGSWPSFPPYKPETIVQQVNEKLRSYQEASALHTANRTCQVSEMLHVMICCISFACLLLPHALHCGCI